MSYLNDSAAILTFILGKANRTTRTLTRDYLYSIMFSTPNSFKMKNIIVLLLFSYCITRVDAQVNSYDGFLGDSLICDYYAQIFFDSSFKIAHAPLNIQRDILSGGIKNKLKPGGENSIAKLRHNEEFKLLIFEKISDKYTLSGFTIRIFELERPMTDYDIRCASDAVALNLGEFCFALIKMLAAQPDGEDGTLSTNGPINVFYVRLSPERTISVSAWWDRADQVWSLRANKLRSWGPGTRVFIK